MRFLLRIGYRLRALVQRLLRIGTNGIKVMLFDGDGRLLLVRHSYVKSHLWMLPGGGIARGEAPEAAAAREMREEVGIDPEALALFATYRTPGAGADHILHLFTARTDAAPRTGVEIEEVRFVDLDTLPDEVSAATLRRIAEYRAGGSPGGAW